MQRSVRLKTIINAVRVSGGARVGELARATGASTMTIRRDLSELERQGMLRRTHGGAITLPARGTRLPYSMRIDSEVEQKHAIATSAASLIPDGASVIIDTGTTCAAVTQALAGRDITALVLSVPAASALGSCPGARIITPGGELDLDELAWTGHRAIREIREFRADYAVIGVCAWDEEAGLTATSAHDADVKKAIIDSAQRVIAVSTANKIGTSATFTACPTDRIHVLVTQNLPSEAKAWMTIAGIEIIDNG
jgi:DeoR/GlpR family transcriptional regulator of sugar metabolism